MWNLMTTKLRSFEQGSFEHFEYFGKSIFFDKERKMAYLKPEQFFFRSSLL